MWRYRPAAACSRDHACAAPLRYLVSRSLSSGDMGFELCYLPDMPAVLRALAGAVEKWWQQLEAAKKHPEGFG